MKVALLIIGLMVFGLAPAANPPLSPKDDPRYCGFVPRDAQGNIKRNATELAHFQQIHPCPSTGLKIGACPGWAIDHVWSLACGGCDAVGNMQWLPNRIKSCTDGSCKDRFERKIQYVLGPIPGLNVKSCNPELVTFP